MACRHGPHVWLVLDDEILGQRCGDEFTVGCLCGVSPRGNSADNGGDAYTEVPVDTVIEVRTGQYGVGHGMMGLL